MPIRPPQPQDNAGIVVIVLIAAALCVRYWRIAISLIVIAALTLTILGIIEGVNTFYRLIV
jgi:hypothetical protein